MNYENNYFKIIHQEYENQFNEYRDEDVEEKEKYINKILSELSIHQLLKEINLNESLWRYDVVSIDPSAMWDEISIYPRTETVYAFTKDMNDEFV